MSVLDHNFHHHWLGGKEKPIQMSEMRRGFIKRGKYMYDEEKPIFDVCTIHIYVHNK